MKVIDSFFGEYRFLSNFYPCVVRYNGVPLPSVEHAYVSAKIGLHTKERLQEVALLSAGQVKRLGRVEPMVDGWEEVKYQHMLSFVREKFNEDQKLSKKLVATGDAILIEGNTWGDTYWGICRGVGENNLGKILMIVRKEVWSDWK